jgi:hypothetical protein
MALPLVLLAVLVPSAAASPPRIGDGPGTGATGFGAQCANKPTNATKASCYVKLILEDLNSSNPANEVPALERRIRAAGGWIAGACHPLMHQVGRTYAKRHHVTLGTLQRYLPRSNSPGCSAGFGHGLMMALGPQIMSAGPKAALRTCMKLSTRMRQYSCVHGLGHAYMRLFDDYLRYALPYCKKLGPSAAPDCAQGAFHDYWIASSGRDATTHRGKVTSPRVLCGVRTGDLALACWYRVYVERPPKHDVTKASDFNALCAGLESVQRQGCIAAAALSAASFDPFKVVRLCASLRSTDIAACLRAVPVEDVGSAWRTQVALIRTCGHIKAGARTACYRWFGRTLNVVTNGGFGPRCSMLASVSGRHDCRAGARQYRGPLVTFA